MTLDIHNAKMSVSSGVFVVHEPHGGIGVTTVAVVIIPMLICAWWQRGKDPAMVGIISQSFQ